MALAVLHSPDQWKARFAAPAPPSVVTIGNFDGIHVGHQKILHAVLERARAGQGLSAVVTFDPHPLRILRPEEAPSLLMTLGQRLAAFEELGLDAVLILRFDRALSLLSPEEFVRRILVETMRARAVLVGGNFRFGHRQAGDVRLLTEMGKTSGFAVETISPVVVRGAVVSSSVIRQALREGHVTRAARFLGRPFSLAGEIRPGTGQGRRLIVPTLNLATEQELLPKAGVYVTETCVGGKLYRSATNIGIRPTFDGRGLTIESHLFDFGQELQSGAMEVRFWKRLRDEQKFPGPEALRSQVMRDLARARRFFARLDRCRETHQTA
jgi:riboflavin kinase / FMN adenylyltransferase